MEEPLLIEEEVMSLSKAMTLSLVLGFVSFASSVAAETLTAELAKKCRELMIKAYPRPPVGSKFGNAQKQRDYFRACVAQNAKPR
jgi:hypothetical protein